MSGVNELPVSHKKTLEAEGNEVEVEVDVEVVRKTSFNLNSSLSFYDKITSMDSVLHISQDITSEKETSKQQIGQLDELNWSRVDKKDNNKVSIVKNGEGKTISEDMTLEDEKEKEFETRKKVNQSKGMKKISCMDAIRQAFEKGLNDPRVTLPIDEHKDEILGRINRDRVTIIHGETGCGKSTRVPVMLLEDADRRGIPCRMMVR